MTTGRLTNEELRLIAVDAYDQRIDYKARRDMARECIASRKQLVGLAEANHNLTVDLKRERTRLVRAANQITAAVRIYDAFQCSVVTVPLRIQRAIDAFGDLLREDADR